MLKNIFASLMKLFTKTPTISQEEIKRTRGYDAIIHYSDDLIPVAGLGIRFKDETITLIDMKTGKNYYTGFFTDYELKRSFLNEAEKLIEDSKKEQASDQPIEKHAEEKKVEFQLN